MKASRPAPQTIEDYVALHPSDVQIKLRAIRDEVRALAPGAEEKISYGMPTFSMGKNIFHFAAFKNHIGLYPGPAAIEALAAGLVRYKTSKGAIQIPLAEAVPLALVRKLVRFNLKAFASNPKGKKAGAPAGSP